MTAQDITLSHAAKNDEESFYVKSQKAFPTLQFFLPTVP